MRRWALLLFVLVTAFVASCREATQVAVVLRTNVPYESGAGVALWSSRSGTVGVPQVEEASPWLADGEIGDVFVVPGDAPKESKLSLRVAMGLRGKRAAECTDQADAKDCIIARRKLSFVPRTRLKVPIVMYLACEGVKCSEDTTCSYLGKCVPAEVDPAACASAEGCTLPGDPPFEPGVVADAGRDGASDTATDSSPGDAGGDSGGFDADAGVPQGIQLAAGANHTCARLDDGSVKCWGANDFGQLGLGDTQRRGGGPGEMGTNLPAVDLGPGRTAFQLASGSNHTCARLDNGAVRCWGLNIAGQLGLGDSLSRGDGPGEMGTNLPVVDLGPGRTAIDLAAGNLVTCARLDDATVKCWGFNGDGELGLGDALARGDAPGEMGANLPIVDLGPGRTALQLTIGEGHVCALLDDATVKCWGFNDDGQLGLGDTLSRGTAPGQMGANLPVVNVGPGRTVLQLSAGANHTCVRLDNASIKCWGSNSGGRLGLGDALPRGDGPGEMGANLPAVNLGRTALQLGSGFNHTCTLLDDTSVKCWGSNSTGQLGLGDVQTRGAGPAEMGANLPAVDFGPGRSAVQLTAGSGHGCARLDDETVRCWGVNNEGQLGLGDLVTRGDGPGEMGNNLPAVQLK